MKPAKSKRLTTSHYQKGLISGDRIVLAKAITLLESRLPADQRQGQELLDLLKPKNKTIRVGITGIPGVGKSTFIEALGKHLTSLHKKVAVLTIDPTSQKTKGSILGDKTRMEELSKDPLAFIRPTATGTSSGGVADATREAILLCEAAGFDVILVETIGVGQSEVAVRGMVDFFLLLMLPGAGDELQGIKKGIMEMADAIVITKSDGDNIKKAKQAQADFKYALHLFQPGDAGWKPEVLVSSAYERRGITETWQLIEAFREITSTNGFFVKNRKQQSLSWFQESLMRMLKENILTGKKLKTALQSAEARVLAGKILPSKAAREIIQAFLKA